jgi:probable HAF family extracellular repeat protein
MTVRILALTAVLVLAVALVCAPIQLPQVRAQAQPAVPEVQLVFTTVDCPGKQVTIVYGINSVGDMTGNCADSLYDPSSGFVYRNGDFTLFDYPGADTDTTGFGINDSGLISGWGVRQAAAAVGFLYDGTNFKAIRAPGASATFARGINNAGVVVGAQGSFGAVRGFALIGSLFRKVSPPGSYLDTFADGINNLNQIVGTADEGGFYYGKGVYKTIAFPGASQTWPVGINDDGIVVGWYTTDGCVDCGFAYRKGKFVSLRYPGALATFTAGINNQGQIVGTYQVDSSTLHGFVTSPITAADFPVSADND